MAEELPQLAGAKVGDADGAHQALPHQALHGLRRGGTRHTVWCHKMARACCRRPAEPPSPDYAAPQWLLPTCHVSRMEGCTWGPTLPVTGPAVPVATAWQDGSVTDHSPAPVPDGERRNSSPAACTGSLAGTQPQGTATTRFPPTVDEVQIQVVELQGLQAASRVFKESGVGGRSHPLGKGMEGRTAGKEQLLACRLP